MDERKFVLSRIESLQQDIAEAEKNHKGVSHGEASIIWEQFLKIHHRALKLTEYESLIPAVHGYDSSTKQYSGTMIQYMKTTLRGIKDALSLDLDNKTKIEKIDVKSETKKIEKISENKTSDVFVVHGRNLACRDSLFAFLRSIGIHPLEWSTLVESVGKGSPYVGEILDEAFSRARAVIVLMTPDDEARLRKDFQTASDPPHEVNLTPQARPNVLFEAGMAMGNFPDRTILVEIGDLRPFSDVGGRHVIRLNNSTQRRQEFAQRLKAAGLKIDLSGTTWHTEGNFVL